MMNHANPITSFTKGYDQIPEATYISKNGYFFVFGLQDSDSIHFYDETIYSVSLTYSIYNSTVPFVPVNINIPIERCTPDNLPSSPILRNYFEETANNLSELLCFQKDWDNKMRMKGTWDNLNFENINIDIKRCINSTDPLMPVCKSANQIDNLLSSGFFAYYSTETIIDLLNFEQAATRVGLDYYTDTNLNITKILTRYISSTNIQSDIGWILEDTLSSDYENFEKDSESFDFVNSPEDSIMQVQVRKSTYKLLYKRSYKKIQTVLAEMGGFLKITFLFFSLFSYPFTNHLYYDNISNTLYNFQNNEKDEEKQILQQMQTIKMEQKNGERKIFNDEMGVLRVDEDKLLNYFLKLKSKPLAMNFCEYFQSFFIDKPELVTRKTQRKKALGTIFERLDIKYLLKKFLEIDKLKFLLLTSDQLQIFDNLPKPMITKRGKLNINSMNNARIKMYNRASAEYLKEKNENKIKAKITIFTKCFTNIVRKPELDEIDRKLLNFIGEDLKNMLGINEMLKSKRPSSKPQIALEEKLPDFKTSTKDFLVESSQEQIHILNK